MDISLYENEDPDSEHTSRAAVTLRFSGLTMKEIGKTPIMSHHLQF